jgi:hypothetical protein
MPARRSASDQKLGNAFAEFVRQSHGQISPAGCQNYQRCFNAFWAGWPANMLIFGL